MKAMTVAGGSPGDPERDRTTAPGADRDDASAEPDTAAAAAEAAAEAAPAAEAPGADADGDTGAAAPAPPAEAPGGEGAEDTAAEPGAEPGADPAPEKAAAGADTDAGTEAPAAEAEQADTAGASDGPGAGAGDAAEAAPQPDRQPDPQPDPADGAREAAPSPAPGDRPEPGPAADAAGAAPSPEPEDSADEGGPEPEDSADEGGPEPEDAADEGGPESEEAPGGGTAAAPEAGGKADATLVFTKPSRGPAGTPAEPAAKPGSEPGPLPAEAPGDGAGVEPAEAGTAPAGADDDTRTLVFRAPDAATVSRKATPEPQPKPGPAPAAEDSEEPPARGDGPGPSGGDGRKRPAWARTEEQEAGDPERTTRFAALKPPATPAPTAPEPTTPRPAAPRPANPAPTASRPPAPAPKAPRPATPAAPRPAAPRPAPRPQHAAPAPAAYQPPPLDLPAVQLPHTEPRRRPLLRSARLWAPVGLLLLAGGFAGAQLLRPLPAPRLVAAEATRTVDGQFSVPWPAKGQGAVRVAGSGDVGSFGEQKPVPTASVAKVMTAYVILKGHPLRKNEPGPSLTVDAKAVAEGKSEDESRIEGLTAGQKFSQLDMLKMLMIPSGNNAARLLARWDTGTDSEAAFVEKMNAAARDLGMKDTTYTDPSGLDAGTVSTAADQLKLAEAVMKDEVFRSIVAMPSAPIKGLPEPLVNNNTLLTAQGLSVRGIKTGSSTPAGGALMWAAYKSVGDETPLILGTLMEQRAEGSDPNATRSLALVLSNTKKIIESVRSALASAPLVRKGDVVGYVDDGLGGRTPLVAAKDLNAIAVPGQRFKLSLSPGASPLRREAKAGTEVGTLTAGEGDGAKSVPVAVRTALEEPSLGTRLTRLR
ncbi:D-alanyl-D-alanine carboxypeptidase [Streptomyces globosus]|uniref:D-alanyl-D-alanine carboxypeptidase n=1 Tax=Streptomyces globosus TaxID=68209 RepID=UPI003802155C